MPAAQPSSAHSLRKPNKTAKGVVVRHERFSRRVSIAITIALSPLLYPAALFVLVGVLFYVDRLRLAGERYLNMLLVSGATTWIAAALTLALTPFVYRRLRWRLVEYEGQFCWKCRHDFGTAPSETCPDCGTERMVIQTSVRNPWLNAVGWMLWFIIIYAVASFVMGGLVMQGVPLPRWVEGGVPMVLAAVNATLRLQLNRRRVLRKEEARCKALRSKGLCHVCKYDLTGNVSGRCPECGTAIEELA